MTPREYLKKCTDAELFEIVNGINYEIKDRLIALFKSNGCTAVEISEEGIEASVNDMYGLHKWKENDDILEKWVKITEIGYGIVLDEEHKPLDYLYVVTTDCEQYTNDEINDACLWDLYHTVKEALEKK